MSEQPLDIASLMQIEDLKHANQALASMVDDLHAKLEKVRRMIGDICGWYSCTDWFDECERTDVWEQVGELLGRLQREAE